MSESEDVSKSTGGRRWSPMTRRRAKRFSVSLTDRTTVQWIASAAQWNDPTVLDAHIVDVSTTGASVDIANTSLQIPESMKLTIGSLESFVSVKGVTPCPVGARLHVHFEQPSQQFQLAVHSMVERLAA
jgi:hypothetical protein